jgi:hypothetical protein
MYKSWFKPARLVRLAKTCRRSYTDVASVGTPVTSPTQFPQTTILADSPTVQVIKIDPGTIPNTEQPVQIVIPQVEPDVELEVKDPLLIFDSIVKKLEEKYGREKLIFPKEIYFLLGAPVRFYK